MKEKLLALKNRPGFLLIIAAVLLLAGTAGTVRAALAQISEDYGMEANVSRIGVTLLENERAVGYRNYEQDPDTKEWGWSVSEEGKLLEKMLWNEEKQANDKLILGRSYEEKLQVQNSGDMDTYVRATISKYWQDPQGEKDLTLNPALIRLNLLLEESWMEDKEAATPERVVLYYKKPLLAGETTEPFMEGISIDTALQNYVTEDVVAEDNAGRTIAYQYRYDNYTGHLDVSVDAVQTHSTGAAISSAWGIDMKTDEEGVLQFGEDPGNPSGETSFSGADNWTVTYNGTGMTSNFSRGVMADQFSGLQPGDSITVQVNLANTSAGDADWYMTNDTVKTLEDNSAAAGGAYTYRLLLDRGDGTAPVNLYDSSAVGGEGSKTYLHEATEKLDEFFYLTRLGKGKKAKVTLQVQLEGESQGNSYQSTMTQLNMNFGAGKAYGQTYHTTNVKTVDREELVTLYAVDTGDSAKTAVFCAAALASGTVLASVALRSLWSRRKERREQR